MTAAVFDERIDPGRGASALLSLVVHLLLLAVLVFGVSWQNRPAETVSVELWDTPAVLPPKAAPPEPLKPVVEPPKPAPRVEEPPPPKPVPKIEKPDIVEKAPPPKAKPAPPKPEPKPAPLKPRVDESQRRIQEALAREQAALAVDREQVRLHEQLASEARAASARGLADWMGKVRAKVRGNMFLPPDVQGNPEAIFEVVQLPTGEVLTVKLKKSSGHAALDQAIERAILKSSPLPKPDKEAPPRSFDLKYRPRDPL